MYNLHLDSYDTYGTIPSAENLLEDMVEIIVTEYTRITPIISWIAVTHSQSKSFDVEHVYSVIDLSAYGILSINLRQTVG